MAISGKYIYITLDGVKLAGLKSCKLSTGAGTIETASPDTGQWRTFLAGRKEWEMSCSWLVLSAAAMNGNALRSGTTYTITFTGGGTPLSGQAICTRCDVDAAVGGLAKGAFTFKGSGELKDGQAGNG